MLTQILATLIQLAVLSGLGAGLGLAIWRWSGLGPGFLAFLVWAAACFVSYALFWTWLWSDAWAVDATRLAWIASVLAAIPLWRRAPAIPWTSAALPFALMATLAASSLLIYGAHPTGPSRRFAFQLPVDHLLPRMAADRIETAGRNRHALTAPLDGENFLTDRPPLQSAIVLATRTLAPYRPNDYQTTGTICQAAVLPALWAFCSLLSCTRRERAFILIAVCLSGQVLLNSIFVWPKLLSGALFLGALAVLLEPYCLGRLPSVRYGCLAGVLFALSLLAHTGSAFSVLGLPIVLIAIWGWRCITRSTVAAGLSAVAVLATWTVFQQDLGQPGTRLLKIHLAGTQADGRPFLQALADQYDRLSATEIVQTRIANLAEQWFVPFAQEPVTWTFWIQWQQFYHAIPALGVLAPGLLLMAWRAFGRGRNRMRPALDRALVGLAAVSWAIWIGAMFAPHTALVHHGSYGTLLLLLALGGLGLSRMPSALGLPLLAAHTAIFVLSWALPAGIGEAARRPAWSYAGLAALALFSVLAWRAPEDRDPV